MINKTKQKKHPQQRNHKTQKKRKQQAKPEKNVLDLIAKILSRTEPGKKYIFRGTPIEYDKLNRKGKATQEAIHDFVNSQIYRKHHSMGLFSGRFQPISIEEEIVKKARSQLSPKASNIELLTDIRHFGGDTTLIDFSYDLMVAMFFACNGEIGRNGQIIILPKSDFEEVTEIEYKKNESQKNLLIKPVRTPLSEVRIIAQSSVFIHAPNGYIPINRHDKYTINQNLKQSVLDYLREFQNISVETIYNDLPGFLDNEQNFEDATLKFYYGNSKIILDKYEDAIEDYDEAIRLNPDLMEAYVNRAICYIHLDDYKESLSDLNKAIKLDPTNYMAYTSRGSVLSRLGRQNEAFSDFKKSISINSNYGTTYYNRAIANLELEQMKEALEDYNIAIELDSNLPPLRGLHNED